MTTIEHMKNNSRNSYIVQRKTCDVCGGKILFADFADGSEIEKCIECGKESN